MEKNPDSHQASHCANNCGFYGDPRCNNLCSLCFNKSKNAANQPSAATTAASVSATETQTPIPAATVSASGSEASAATSSIAAATDVGSTSLLSPAAISKALSQSSHAKPAIEDDEARAMSSTVISSSVPCSGVASPLVDLSSASESCASTPARKVQAKKGRCFQCRARVALVKQTTNKCRCEYVFCDSHRLPDQHDCEFDFMTRERKTLEKNNPKLNMKRKGGLSFTRID